MVASTSLNCAYPEDFELAVFKLQQQISESLASILHNNIPPLNANADAIKPSLDAVEALLNQMLAPGVGTDGASPLTSTKELETIVGLPVTAPTVTDNEKTLQNIGLILFDGVVYTPPKPAAPSPPKYNVLNTQDAAIANAIKAGADPSAAIAANAVTAPAPAPNSTLNISNLRSLYRSSSYSLDLAQTYINQNLRVSGSTFVVQRRLRADRYPSFITDATILTATAALDPSFSKDDIVTAGAHKYAVYWVLEGVNKSLLQLTNPEEIASHWYCYNQISTTTKSQNDYKALGCVDTLLTTLLNGQSVVDNAASLKATRALFSTISSDINKITLPLVQTLLNQIPTFALSTIANALTSRLLEISGYITAHKKAMNQLVFEVVTFYQLDTLALLRVKHSDSEIQRLLINRTISSMDLEPNPSDVYKAVTAALSVPANSAATSTGYINSVPASIYNQKILDTQLALLLEAQLAINQALVALATNDPVNNRKSAAAALTTKAQGFLTTYVSYQGVYGLPQKIFPGGEVAITATTKPIGVSSLASPATIIYQNVNVTSTYPVYSSITAAVGNTADPHDHSGSYAAKLIAEGLNALLGVIKSILNGLQLVVTTALNAISAITSAMQSKILPMKHQMDSILSKFNALTGSGQFDSSLLKCAVSFNLGISFTLLDQILALLNNIGAKIQGFITGFVSTINEMINQILCIPVNLINGLLNAANGALNSALGPLAGICTVPPFTLPQEIQDALAGFKFAISTKQLSMQSMGGDCVKVSLGFSAAPVKGNQFKASAACSGGGSPAFFNSAQLNLSAGSVLPTSLPLLGSVSAVNPAAAAFIAATG